MILIFSSLKLNNESRSFLVASDIAMTESARLSARACKKKVTHFDNCPTSVFCARYQYAKSSASTTERGGFQKSGIIGVLNIYTSALVALRKFSSHHLP